MASTTVRFIDVATRCTFRMEEDTKPVAGYQLKRLSTEVVRSLGGERDPHGRRRGGSARRSGALALIASSVLLLHASSATPPTSITYDERGVAMVHVPQATFTVGDVAAGADATPPHP